MGGFISRCSLLTPSLLWLAGSALAGDRQYCWKPVAREGMVKVSIKRAMRSAAASAKAGSGKRRARPVHRAMAIDERVKRSEWN